MRYPSDESVQEESKILKIFDQPLDIEFEVDKCLNLDQYLVGKQLEIYIAPHMFIPQLTREQIKLNLSPKIAIKIGFAVSYDCKQEEFDKTIDCIFSKKVVELDSFIFNNSLSLERLFFHLSNCKTLLNVTMCLERRTEDILNGVEANPYVKSWTFRLTKCDECIQSKDRIIKIQREFNYERMNIEDKYGLFKDYPTLSKRLIIQQKL